jgi:hypothetical protein
VVRVVVVTGGVVAGGVVIAVPAPTRTIVAEGAGSGLMAAGVATAVGGCVPIVVATPANTGGAGRTRA